MNVIVKSVNPYNLPAPVIDYEDPPMIDENPSPIVYPQPPLVQRKRLTKILNIKRIKDCLNEKIDTNSVKFTDAAHRTQQQMYYSEGQDVSLHASFVCLLHLANE